MIKPIEEQFEASYYDGRTAARRLITVELRSDGLFGVDAQIWPYNELRIAYDGAGGEPIRVYRGSETLVLRSRSDAFLEALRQFAPQLDRPGFRLSSWPAIVLACIAIAAVLAGAYYWGIRAAAQALASAAPVKLEERLGRTLVNTLAPSRNRCTGPGIHALDKVAARLTAALPRSPYHFRVEYSKGGIPNAFAAPGGYIVVYQALLEKMETPEELAGVLAHEMEHVIHKHSVRMIAREVSGQALLSLILADPSGTPGALGTATQLVNLRHERTDEEQADTESIALLAKAHIRTSGLADLLRHLSLVPLESQLSYLSTHPATADRIQRISRLSKAANVQAEPLMTASEWESARHACAAN